MISKITERHIETLVDITISNLDEEMVGIKRDEYKKLIIEGINARLLLEDSADIWNNKNLGAFKRIAFFFRKSEFLYKVYTLLPEVLKAKIRRYVWGINY